MSLLKEVERLNINPRGPEGRSLYAYALRVKADRKFWQMLNNLYVVGHESKSTFVMCERIISGTRSFVRCHNKACGMRESMTKNIDKIVDLKPLLKKMCIHAKVCSILSLPEGSDRTSEEEHFIEVCDSKLRNIMVAVVHLAKDTETGTGKKIGPGLLCLNSRTVKPKCLSCEGTWCVHKNIYCSAAKVDNQRKSRRTGKDNIDVQTNASSPLKAEKLEAKAEKSKNDMDPSDKIGKAANVFNIKINNPPSKSEREEINKININPSLFPSGFAFPRVAEEETCKCGFSWEEAKQGNIESTKMVIHHGHPTNDSRNSVLFLLYLTTGKCLCIRYYTGEEDKLLRVSGVCPKRKLDSEVHFLSYGME